MMINLLFRPPFRNLGLIIRSQNTSVMRPWQSINKCQALNRISAVSPDSSGPPRHMRAQRPRFNFPDCVASSVTSYFYHLEKVFGFFLLPEGWGPVHTAHQTLVSKRSCGSCGLNVSC
ncbi:Uncharacterized protein HZ326_20904 [Fusarium oxysporum f. sp. albedinis]|nr:Uncharacterized protein HZ326_20904 [Fusarium oxysporum f. sp. albedinis]